MAVLIGLCTTWGSALCTVHRAVPRLSLHVRWDLVTAAWCSHVLRSTATGPSVTSAIEMWEHQFSTFCLPRRLFLQIHAHPFPAHLPRYLPLQEAFTQHPTASVKQSKALITLPQFASIALICKHATVYVFLLIVVDLLPPLEGKHPEDRNFVLFTAMSPKARPEPRT